jgi:hypothetical protein
MNFNKIFATIFSLTICFSTANLLSQQIYINELMSSNTSSILDFDGESSDWIEIYNAGSQSINLEGYFLSDNPENLNKWEFPNTEINAKDYLIIWSSGKDKVFENGEIHTNFKIESSGEEIFLVDKNRSSILDQSPAISLLPNISMGRKPNNGSNWFVFNEATPKRENTSQAFNGIAKSPSFSHKRGFYNSGFNLTLTAENSADKIHYTIDGAEPTLNSSLYSSPININKTTVLRIRVFNTQMLSSPIITSTYLFNENTNINVVSLVTEHSNLWGNTGIYDHVNSGEERPIHIEYFEQNGDEGFNIDAGVKIHGPDGRAQQSLRLYTRAEYGNKTIKYKIFDEKDIDKFSCLILRNGANDGAQLGKTHIRDPYTHMMFQQLNPEYAVSAYRPVHVYINGNYWGIYNLRERQDTDYIKKNYGFKEDEIDFLEYDYAESQHMKTIAGDWTDFNNLKSFVENNDLSVEANYNTMKKWMNMDNFIDYQIIEIFIGNPDWCNNNIKFWRPKAEGGKWNWVLWDTDYGLGTYNNAPVGKPEFNFFSMAMGWGGWGDGDYTWLLRQLMTNQKFKQQFVSRSLDILNSLLKSEYATSEFTNVANGIEQDIQRQLDRWTGTYAKWEDQLDHARYFMSNRALYFRNHMAEKLEFSSETHQINLDVSDSKMGRMKINSILLDATTPGISENPFPWTGEYFEAIPVTISAIAKPGYHFARWQGENNSTEEVITLNLNNNSSLLAIFEEDETQTIEFAEGNNINLNLYPNPTTNFININLDSAGNQKINLQISNLLGQVVYEQSAQTTGNYKSVIDISNLSPAMYLLTIKLESGSHKTEKFLIR